MCEVLLQSGIWSGFPDYGFPAYFCHSKKEVFYEKHVKSDKIKLENHSLENQTWSLAVLKDHMINF